MEYDVMDLIRRLRGGGTIVSSAGLSVAEIADAKAARRMWVDAQGYGYVYKPAKDVRKRGEMRNPNCGNCKTSGGDCGEHDLQPILNEASRRVREQPDYLLIPEVRERLDKLRRWPTWKRGGAGMNAIQEALLAITEERDRLLARLKEVEAENARLRACDLCGQQRPVPADAAAIVCEACWVHRTEHLESTLTAIVEERDALLKRLQLVTESKDAIAADSRELWQRLQTERRRWEEKHRAARAGWDHETKRADDAQAKLAAETAARERAEGELKLQRVEASAAEVSFRNTLAVMVDREAYDQRTRERDAAEARAKELERERDAALIGRQEARRTAETLGEDYDAAREHVRALEARLGAAPLYHAFPNCKDGSGARDGCPGCRWMQDRSALSPSPAPAVLAAEHASSQAEAQVSSKPNPERRVVEAAKALRFQALEKVAFWAEKFLAAEGDLSDMDELRAALDALPAPSGGRSDAPCLCGHEPGQCFPGGRKRKP